MKCFEFDMSLPKPSALNYLLKKKKKHHMAFVNTPNRNVEVLGLGREMMLAILVSV